MHLPGPLRAAVGLVVTAADEAKTLPDRAVELPMLAVSTALQLSLRAQQRYARLAARGDAVLNRQEPGQEPPEWATFDDPLSAEDLHRSALAQLDELVEEFGRASESKAGTAEPDDGGTPHGPGLADIFGQAEPGPAVEDPSGDSLDESGESRGPGESDEADTATVTPISDAPSNARKSARKTSRKTPAKKAAGKKVAAKKAPAAKKTAAKRAPAKKAPSAAAAAKKAPTTTTAAKKAAAKKAADPGVQAAAESAENGKQVDAPRHSAPSTSDDADD